VADAISAAVTALGLIMLAAAVGTAAASAWLLPASTAADIQPLLGQLRLALWRLFGSCLLVVTVANGVELLLRTASFSELPLGEAFPEIGTVLLKTHYGGLWLARSAMILTLWIAWALHRRRLASRLLPVVMLGALTVIAVTLSAAGHAGDDGLFTLVNLANSLHIVGAFLWAGGILVTALIILPRLRGSAEASSRALVADASLRLSSLATLALALVLIPGSYNAWLQVGSWHGLVATTYGQLLIAKIALVAVMMLLGALNRYRYVPALQDYGARPRPRILLPLPAFIHIRGDSAAVLHFLRSLRVEMALVLAVLAVAALLSQQTPAVHAEHDDMAPQQHEHQHGAD